jgi:shikimate kinase
MEKQISLRIITNISLIGFMGSGKTSTGKILADRLNFLFIDLDDIIELSLKMPISEIFEKHGEEYFRNTETNSIKKIYVNKNCVFACGGGVIVRHENIKIIKQNSTVIFLHVSPTEAFKRLKSENNRPLLNAPDKLKAITELMEKRDFLYRDASDLTVKTDFKNPEETAEEILQRLEK